ncbi:MAG: ATP-binding protein [Candidatus Aminicenantes bacterium]|nr:MAG: ATP-binding protein [Candidatus Aminicenantes bacterium]
MAEKVCTECQDTGWVLEESSSGAVAKRCKCYKDQQIQNLLDQANIPRRYRSCTFSNFEIHDDSHKHATKIAKKFVENFPAQDVGLLFQGPCGVGKTHLAVATINELVKKKNVPCYFCDFRELIRNIQSTYTPDSHLTESNILEPVFQKDVLVLDELGAKRTTAWVEETVFYIINNRYNNKKLTVFTSNYIDSEEEEEDTRESYYKKSDDTLVDRIGIRLRSRIYEMCKIVNVWGEDYRKKVKQAGYRF